MSPSPSGPGSSPQDLFEAAFRRIEQERMTGVALLNPALRVEVVGASFWQDSWLAVLITPWCMNLIRLPAGDEAGRAAHERSFQRFPAGDFAFLNGSEAEIGDYQSCALFSPMFQFADQESARAVAEAALAALLAPADQAVVAQGAAAPEPGLSRRAFLSGGRRTR